MSYLTALTLVLLLSLRHATALALVTVPPAIPTPRLLQGRDVSTSLSTCAFLNGDPSKQWVAPNGFDCRVDTLHGIWGFCPTTVISATDCGLGAFCFDSGPCSTGCGCASLRDNTQVTTWTWPDQTMCSTATLIFGPDQSYDYVDCARTASKATYFVSPRDAVASTTSSQSSTSPSKQLSTSVPTPMPVLSSPWSTVSSSTPSSTATSTSFASVTSSGSITSNSVRANQTEQTQGSSSSTSSTNNTAAIIGGAVGGLALIVGGVIAVVYILRRHNSAPRGSDTSHQDSSSSLDTDRHQIPRSRMGSSRVGGSGQENTGRATWVLV